MKKDIKQNQPDEGIKPEQEDFSPDDYDYPDGYQPQKTNKTAMIITVAAAVAAAAVVAGFFVYLFFFHNDGKTDSKSSQTPSTAAVTSESTGSTAPSMTANRADKLIEMPDLEGLSEKEAYQALNEAGIKYRVKREYSDEIPINYVITQSPWAYEQISAGSEALIYISKGVENEIYSSPRSQSSTTSPSDSTNPSSKRGSDDEYLLPKSDSKNLKESDLKSFDRETLNLALNEIYARHGRKFSAPDIKAYFESKSWYNGTISGSDFDEGVMNSYETYNINLIIAYQEKQGYR